MRIDRKRQRPGSANGWPRRQHRWQINHLGGTLRHFTLNDRLAGFARCERAG
jgi:hypothetical protein